MTASSVLTGASLPPRASRTEGLSLPRSPADEELARPTGSGRAAKIVPLTTDGSPLRRRPLAQSRRIGRVVGLVVFLGSLGMLFLSLLFAYAVMRARVPVWPPAGEEPLPVGLPLLSTIAILSSSIALLAAGRALDPRKRARALIAALGLGGSFLVAQSVLWWVVWSGGWLPSTGGYHSIFYGLTAVHAAHVIPGVALLLAALLRAIRPSALIRPSEQGAAASSASLGLVSFYWHFLAGVWVVMFVAVFLL